MRNQTARANKQKGFSLLELLVALLVGSMAIALVLVLLKNAYRLAGEVKLTQDNKILVGEFVKVFHEDVAGSGYVIDWDLPREDCKPEALVFCSQVVDELPFSGSSKVINQRIVYDVRRLQPARGTFHSVEFGLFKTKKLNGQDALGSSDANQLVLAGLPSADALRCTKLLDTMDCTLEVYRSMASDGIDVYKIIARIENIENSRSN